MSPAANALMDRTLISNATSAPAPPAAPMLPLSALSATPPDGAKSSEFVSPLSRMLPLVDVTLIAGTVSAAEVVLSVPRKANRTLSSICSVIFPVPASNCDPLSCVNPPVVATTEMSPLVDVI